MSSIQYYTPAGFQKLKTELEHLKHHERPKTSQQIAEAAEKGDKKENAEYHTAREHLSFIEMRINELSKDIANARVLHPYQIDTSKVAILTKVTLKYLQTQKNVTYQLVSEKEADLKQKKISVKSPLGSSLLGKKVGEQVTVQVPAGTVSCTILDITA